MQQYFTDRLAEVGSGGVMELPPLFMTHLQEEEEGEKEGERECAISLHNVRCVLA